MDLIIDDTFEDNRDQLRQAVESRGGRVHVTKYFPFGGSLEIPHSVLDRSTFAYGSLQMVKQIGAQGYSSVFHYCNLPQFKCTYYYPRLKEFLLQQNYAMLPYGEIHRKKEWIFSHLGSAGQVFIRPDDGFKTFTGKLCDLERWDRDLELLGFYDVEPEHLCIVSEPRNIKKEWRFVVGSEYDSESQKIISGSLYRQNYKLESIEVTEGKEMEFAQHVVDSVKYRPDPFWILDICETQEGLHVLEVGSMSCSGLYAACIDKIIDTLSQYVDSEWKEFYQIG